MENKQRKQLKSQTHHLNPVVIIADRGLVETVNEEIERALNDHELIKIKVRVGDRLARKALIEEICKIHHAELIQSIGQICCIYRKAEDK